tara:strand:+ start:1056 stop:1178 length:123 start_codon:yes stop_codon:yes gene_type:complete
MPNIAEIPKENANAAKAVLADGAVQISTTAIGRERKKHQV